jgi:hypothetical protein
MKVGLWMLAGSALSSFGIVAFFGDEATPDLRPAVWLGMLGPLAAALCSIAVMERTVREHPERLMAVMIGAFAAKVLFFGGYIALVVKAIEVQTVPFAISFTGYFVALHIVEAWRLRRLVATI